jgi:hypothetical protein
MIPEKGTVVAERPMKIVTDRNVLEVDADCNITYTDGTYEPCIHRPTFTFAECGPGYGSHGDCPKYNYYHKKGKV